MPSPSNNQHTAGGDDDDENDDVLSIGLSSTVNSVEERMDQCHPPGQPREYLVESIVAERKSSSGGMRYLVDWDSFPVHDRTWEPEENLNSILLEEWEDRKREIAAGKREPFALEILRWRDAVLAQTMKRDRRNAKRKELGLPFKTRGDYNLPTQSDWEADSDELAGENIADRIREMAGAANHSAAASSIRARDSVQDGISGPQPFGNDSSCPPDSSRAKNANVDGCSRPQKPAAHLNEATTGNKSNDNPVSRPAVPASGGSSKIRQAVNQQQTTRSQPTAKRAVLGNAVDNTSSDKSAKPAATAPSAPTKKGGLKAHRTMNGPAVQKVTQVNISALTKPKRNSRVSLGTDKEDQGSRPAPRNLASLSARQRFNPHARSVENDAPSAAEVMALLFNPADEPPEPKKAVRALQEVADAHASDPLNKQPHDANGDSTHTMEGSKKKRKFVHVSDEPNSHVAWTPELQVVAEPEMIESDNVVGGIELDVSMDIDPKSPDAQVVPPTESPRSVQKLSLAEYHVGRSALRVPQKDMSFGSSAPVKVLLNGAPSAHDPRVSDEPWLAEFVLDEQLNCRHKCLAELFLARLARIRPCAEKSCAGDITGFDQEAAQALGTVAERLEAGGFGLFLSRQSYAMLVYPIKSDAWDSPSLDSQRTPTDTSVLRYVVFAAADGLPQILSTNVSCQSLTRWGSRCSRVSLMDQVLGLSQSTFEKLSPPPRTDRSADPCFYLIFPDACSAEGFQVSLWIRGWAPNAEVYSSQFPGSWLSFIDKVKMGIRAIVIVHETAMRTLRRLPRFREYLNNPLDHYVWQWPDRAGALNALDSKPTRLFPFGQITLLTPSLVVSEPRCALEIVRSRRDNCLEAIMVAHDFMEWLADLALEKYNRRSRLTQERSRIPAPEWEVRARQEGVAAEDCHAVVLLANEVLEMAGPTTTRDQSYSSSILFADESLDASDEQSLVNWFGWWSMENANQFRIFNVAGTALESSPIRRRRHLSIPNFDRNTINDAHALTRKVAEDMNSEKAAKAEREKAILEETAKREVTKTVAENQARQPEPAVATVSNGPAFYSPEDLKHNLDFLQKHRRIPKGSWRLYGFPIYWIDDRELFRHGMKRSGPGNQISQWFHYTWPFEFEYKLYVGLFYTVDDSYDPDTAQRGQRVPRRPWVGLYRVCQGHEEAEPKELTYIPTELVIVDPAFTQDPDSGNLSQEKLPRAQSATIAHLRENTAYKTRFRSEKQGRQKLCHVWVGGTPHAISHLEPVEQCLKLIDDLLDNPEHVPTAHEQLAKYKFKPVDLDAPAATDEGGGAATPAAGKGTGPNQSTRKGVADADRKVVFHPPVLGDGRKDDSKSCRNRLFEAAQLARSRDAQAVRMMYEHPPTLEWYGEQKSEARGWEYILVATGEEFCARPSEQQQK